jgi:hypothetical protein
MRGQLKNPLRVQRIQRVSLNNLLEQAEQLVLRGWVQRVQLVLRVLLGHLGGQQEQRELQARERLEPLVYLVSTEPQEQLVFADRLELLVLQDYKVLLDFKALLE